MAHRFSDTEIWKKHWFRKLPSPHKLLWYYLFSNCNHAGIWDVDIELAEFQIGDKLGSPDSILENAFNGRIIPIRDGAKWYIPGFIRHQYKCDPETLNPDNKVHQSVISILKKEGVWKGLASPMQGAKEKDKDKDRDKVKAKEKESAEHFEEFWKAYPRKVAKGKCKDMWKRKKLDSLVDTIIDKVEAYKKTEQWRKDKGEFIPNPLTWLNQDRWEDEIPENAGESDEHFHSTPGGYYVAYCSKCFKDLLFKTRKELQGASECCGADLVPNQHASHRIDRTTEEAVKLRDALPQMPEKPE